MFSYLSRFYSDISAFAYTLHSMHGFVSRMSYRQPGPLRSNLLLFFAAKKLQLSLNNFLEERDVEDTTALHMSCCRGYRGVTELLIRHGVDYEAVKGVNLNSPLHLSAAHGHDDITKLLISSGATVDSRNGHLKTSLHQ